MNVQFLEPESKWYFCMWIFLIVISWFLWFIALDHIAEAGSYGFMVFIGLSVGIISGLSPPRAFQVCFLGLFIVALLLAPFGIFVSLFISAALSALFALAGAIMRKIILREEIEINLRSWQWILLISGLTLFGDTVAIGIIQGGNIYDCSQYFIRFFIPSLVGLFAAGLFTGTFARTTYKKLMKSIAKVLIGAHAIYGVYMVYILIFAEEVDWVYFFFFPMVGLLFVTVLIGTRIGFGFRGSSLVRSTSSKKPPKE
jgi:hypothetical protein